MAHKKFRLIDAILSIICIVFVCEAAAPAAAIGNSQFFWWILLIVIFLLPYGLIVSELASTYDTDGGPYDWVRNAFGDKWGARVAWYYWVNFPLWVASLALIFPATISMLVGAELGVVPTLAIELAFIWIVTFVCFSNASNATWIFNLTAVVKVAIAVVVGGLGIWYAATHGLVNPITPASLLPDFTDVQSITYLSIILFNFMGFEVLATFTSEMEDPRVEIPKAIIAGGLAIAAVYLFSSFGISAAVMPSDVALDAGISDAVAIIAGETSPLFYIVSVAFLATLFGNMIVWSYGVNSVACYAAKDGNLPKVFAIEGGKDNMPIGAAVVNGVVASILVILEPVLASLGADGFFWIFFAMNVVFLLLSYIPMFPAFLKLRKVDPDAERPFVCPGKGIVLKLMTWVPVILIILASIATIVPLDGSEDEMSKIPMLVGAAIFIVLGEVVRIISARGREKEFKGIGAGE